MLSITYETLEEWVNLKTSGRGLAAPLFPSDVIWLLEDETGLKVNIRD